MIAAFDLALNSDVAVLASDVTVEVFLRSEGGRADLTNDGLRVAVVVAFGVVHQRSL